MEMKLEIGDAIVPADSERTCKICGKLFITRSDLDTHMKSHPKAKPYQCDLCDKYLRSARGLRRHKLNHQFKPFICDSCPKQFTTKYLLNKHRITHQEERSYPCTHCSQVYKNEASVKMHYETVHLNRYRMLKCETCGMEFKGRGTYESHQVTEHGAAAFICKVCGKQCTSLAYLRGHEQTHIDQKVECDLCQKTFTDKRCLKKHKYRVHNKNRKLYVCEVCGKAVTSTTSYKTHKLIHEGVKQYTCEVCGKSFVGRYGLKIHKVTHTGERPFECKECGNRYSQQSSLIVHVKKVHKK